MMIKAGVWNSLDSKEKMDLLIHYSYYNPLKMKKDRTAMRSVEEIKKIS